MKRIISGFLALAAVLSLCLSLASCANEAKEFDAVMDYYVVRLGKDIEKSDVEYKGYNEETNRHEYFVANEKLEISETIFVEEQGMAYMVYNEQGIRIHIYNSATADKE